MPFFPEYGDSTLDGVVQDALHLELVLVIGVPLCQVAELLGEVEAVRDVLGGDVVLCYLDTVVKIPYLKRKFSFVSLP